MSLLRQGKAQVLTIYIGESDQWQGVPLYVAIVQYLRQHGSAGATVIRAIEGYGAGARLHESGSLRWSSDAPIVIQVVDSPERLRRFLPHIQEMLSGGLMTLHEVEVLKYTHARRRGLPTKLPVAQVMETSVMTVDLTTPVSTIVDLLLAAPFRALPVVDQQGKLQGIISTGDLIQAGVLPMRRGLVRAALELDNTTAEAVETPLEQARLSRLTAQEIMNRQVRTVRPDQPIREAAEIMLQTGLRRLPVVNAEGILLGMLSRADLLQVIVTSPVMHALVIREHALGPEHSYVGQTLNHLGLLFYHQGRYSQAEALLSRSLAIRERAPGTAHPDVASTLYTLARVYSAQEKLDKQMISLDILFSPPVQAYWE